MQDKLVQWALTKRQEQVVDNHEMVHSRHNEATCDNNGVKTNDHHDDDPPHPTAPSYLDASALLRQLGCDSGHSQPSPIITTLMVGAGQGTVLKHFSSRVTSDCTEF